MAIDSSLDPDLLLPCLRRELLRMGYDDRAIVRAVRLGQLAHVRYGAYLDGEVWRELGVEDRHRVRARAVLKTADPTTVLSHWSAAIELGAPTYDVDLDLVHVTRTDRRSGRRLSGVVHHSGRLAEGDVIERNGVRLVSGDRAAMEVTTQAGVESALVTVAGLLPAVRRRRTA